MHPRTMMLGLLVGGLSLTGPAESRVTTQSTYSKARTYSGALRYLRVDLGYEVTERDAKAAYLMFEYLPPGRKSATRGSIEIVATSDGSEVYVQLPQMPEYHERLLADGLMKKLRAEYGEPPKKRPPRKAPEKPDGGANGAEAD